MFIIADHSFWHVWGETTVWIAGTITALGIISKTKPIKWVYCQLISKPMTTWGLLVVGQVVEDKITNKNGGSSIKDQIDEVKEAQVGLAGWTTQVSTNQENIKKSLKNIHTCLDNRFSDTHARMEKLTAYTEEVLAEAIGSKERIRQLYRGLEIPVFETDAAGRCTYVNPAYCRIASTTVEEALGVGWTNAIHHDDVERVVAVWNSAMDHGVDFRATYRLNDEITGLPIAVKGTASPLHDARKAVVGWVGTLDLIPQSTTLGTISTKEELETP